jgi:hypothetical protein
MSSFFKILLTVMILVLLAAQVANAEDVSEKATFSVTIPQAIKLDGIGISPKNQTHGIPIDRKAEFSMLVANSVTPTYWEITTSQPIGVSISYNSGGQIFAVFISMVRDIDGYEIPQENISIYPSKAIFDTGPGGGDVQRIFHFNPIIRVSKKTPPGNYVGTITFTIIGQ